MEGLTVLGWLAERRTSERSEWQFVFRNRRKAQEGAPPYKFFLKIFEGGSDEILKEWQNKELYCYFDTLYQNVELLRRALHPRIGGGGSRATVSALVPIRLRHAPLWSGLDLERLRSLIAFLTPQSLNFFHLQTWTPGTHVYDSRQPPTTSPKGFSCRRPRANHRRA